MISRHARNAREAERRARQARRRDRIAVALALVVTATAVALAPGRARSETAAACPAGDYALVHADLRAAPEGPPATCFYRGPNGGLAATTSNALACRPCLTPPAIPGELQNVELEDALDD